MIRNCLGHNFKFDFRPNDLRQLPVTWKNISITVAMNHQEMPLTFFGYVQAWELFTEIRTFAESTKI
jgi:hypothetical protein